MFSITLKYKTMKRKWIITGILCLLFIVHANLRSQTIWDGPPMTFTKTDYSDWTLPENQDRITEDIWITRGNSRPIFNIAEDNLDSSPLDTRWAFGSIADGVENLEFDYWINTIDESPPEMVGNSMVMFLVSVSVH